jgi:hypothetical protein
VIVNTYYQTQPLIFHAQGKSEFCPMWAFVLKYWENSPKISYGDDSRLDIITWNSGEFNNINCKKNLGTFERSCSVYGVNPIVLGQSYGKSWHNRLKILTTISFLAQSKKPYVMGCDSSDVLLVGNPREILDRFLQEDCEAMFNAELLRWPDKPNLEEFEKSVGIAPFYYFNSGVWIGQRKFCLKFYREADIFSRKTKHNPFSEQVCTKQAYHLLYPLVKVDHTCKLFQTLNRIPPDLLIAS